MGDQLEYSLNNRYNFYKKYKTTMHHVKRGTRVTCKFDMLQISTNPILHELFFTMIFEI